MPATGFYAVANGRTKGVFHTWDDCKAQVDGFQGAKYKKFKTEAEAKTFVSSGAAFSSASQSNSKAASSSGSMKRRAEDDNGVAKSSKRKANDSAAADSEPTYADGVRIIEAYTDGASSNNGQNGARAGWGVHWPEGARDSASDLHGLDESRRLDGEQQTNNRAELMGIIRAIELCPDPDARLHIFSDSRYSIDCINKWQANWRKNGWFSAGRKDVKNRDLVRKLERLMRARKYRPTLLYVKGHGSSVGNNEADRLAVAGARLPDVPKETWVEHEPPPSDEESGKVLSNEANRKRAKAMWAKAGFTADEADKRVNVKRGDTE